MELPIVTGLLLFVGLMIVVLVVQPWLLQLATAMGGQKVVPWGRAALTVVIATVVNLIVGCGLGLTGVGALVSWVVGLFVWAVLISKLLDVDFGRGMIVGLIMTMLNWGLMLLVAAVTGAGIVAASFLAS